MIIKGYEEKLDDRDIRYINYVIDKSTMADVIESYIKDLYLSLIHIQMCIRDSNKPIPLVQKLSVEEIKARLKTVEKHSFYITYTDDSQLLSMIILI